MTPFARAMPDEYKVGNALKSYREYYRHGKIHLHSWKKRPVPEFIVSVSESFHLENEFSYRLNSMLFSLHKIVYSSPSNF